VTNFRVEPMSRRKVLQRAAAGGLALTWGGAISACSNDGSDSSQRTLTFIKGPHHPDELKFQRANAAAFMQAHKDYRIDPSLYDWGTVDTELTTAFASSNPPDISYLVTRLWTQFADAGAIQDVTDRVKAADFKSEFDAYSPGAWEGVTYKGKIWGVPLIGAVVPIYVNHALIEEAGASGWSASYEQMRAAAARIRGGDTFGFSMDNTFIDEVYFDLQAYIHNAGASLFNPDGTAGGLDTPEVVEAFEVLRQIYVDDRSAPEPGLYDGEAGKALFQAGRIALRHDDTFLVQQLEQKEPDFEWSVAKVPPGPQGQTVAGDFGYLCIAAECEDPDAAWEYIKFLSSREQVVKYVNDLGKAFQAVRNDVADEIFAGGDSAGKTLQADFIPDVVQFAPHPKQGDALRALVSSYERMIRGELSAAQAIAEANEKITQAVA
jgi:multiple sugar transport system substrate-binding protein